MKDPVTISPPPIDCAERIYLRHWLWTVRDLLDMGYGYTNAIEAAIKMGDIPIVGAYLAEVTYGLMVVAKKEEIRARCMEREKRA